MNDVADILTELVANGKISFFRARTLEDEPNSLLLDMTVVTNKGETPLIVYFTKEFMGDPCFNLKTEITESIEACINDDN